MALNANALVTLNLAKNYLKIPLTILTQDWLVELCINAASDHIESICGRKLKQQAHTEYHHGRRNNILMPREYPLVSITSMSIDHDANFAGNELILAATDWAISDDDNCIIYKNNFFPIGYNNVKLVYTAGYSPIPSDIQKACLWMVAYDYQMNQSGDIGRTSKGKGDESINILQEYPKEIEKMLSPYMRCEIPNISSGVRNG